MRASNATVEAIARGIFGPPSGGEYTVQQLREARTFINVIEAIGLSVIPKSEADSLERRRKKSGGEHPEFPGKWHVSSLDGWVGLVAGVHTEFTVGRFSPDEAREIGMTLIEFAAQEERSRR